jgi:hypothetical protein
MKLVIGYLFEPQNGTIMGMVEKAIASTLEERAKIIRLISQPELERITSGLNPVAIYLRHEDNRIREQLQEKLREKLQPIGYNIAKIDIDDVVLPEDLQTKVTANLQLLRQSIQNFTPDDFARITVTMLGEGLRKGGTLLTTPNLNSIIMQSMTPEDRPPTIDALPENDEDVKPPDPSVIPSPPPHIPRKKVG